MNKLKLSAALAAVLVTVIVILQNTQNVETTFLFFTITLPNAALLGLTLLIGMAAGILVAMALYSKKERKKE